jgi:hypothetical protein
LEQALHALHTLYIVQASVVTKVLNSILAKMFAKKISLSLSFTSISLHIFREKLKINIDVYKFLLIRKRNCSFSTRLAERADGTYLIFSCRRPTARLAKLVLSHTTASPSSLPRRHLQMRTCIRHIVQLVHGQTLLTRISALYPCLLYTV